MSDTPTWDALAPEIREAAMQFAEAWHVFRCSSLDRDGREGLDAIYTRCHATESDLAALWAPLVRDRERMDALERCGVSGLEYDSMPLRQAIDQQLLGATKGDG